MVVGSTLGREKIILALLGSSAMLEAGPGGGGRGEGGPGGGGGGGAVRRVDIGLI